MPRVAGSPVPAGAAPDRAEAVRFARWSRVWLRLAVALAFADASIVVLALPQIVDRLHTPIAHVTWVIMAYNLALIVACGAVAAGARRLPARPTLLAGLALFGLASIGCGASSTLGALIVLRCLQGVGGALMVSASLPLFAGVADRGAQPLVSWAATAAIGAAVGPAAGGILTQVFDWRAIFFAQAPVAALAAGAILVVERRVADPPTAEPSRRPWTLGPVTANVALALLSAGVIGALFLVVIELIDAWLLTPIAAAAVVTTIPLATAVTERLVRGRAVAATAAAGAVLLALGLVVLALLNHRELGWVIVALVLCGAGLGLAFPGLTSVALGGPGPATARAATTVAARDAGLVLGLLILTPVFAAQINHLSANEGPAVSQVTALVLRAPLPLGTKFLLGAGMADAYRSAGQADVPRIGPVFAAVASGADPAQRATLAGLEAAVNAVVQRAVTPAFRRPYLIAAVLAVAVAPLLALSGALLRRRPGDASPGLSGTLSG